MLLKEQCRPMYFLTLVFSQKHSWLLINQRSWNSRRCQIIFGFSSLYSSGAWRPAVIDSVIFHFGSRKYFILFLSLWQVLESVCTHCILQFTQSLGNSFIVHIMQNLANIIGCLYYDIHVRHSHVLLFAISVGHLSSTCPANNGLDHTFFWNNTERFFCVLWHITAADSVRPWDGWWSFYSCYRGFESRCWDRVTVSS